MNPARTAWFDEARLGMFVHWDHASQQGLEVSWPMVGGVFSLPKCQSVLAHEYHALAASFDPVAYDPDAIARQALACGMGYLVFTTRHHNGFSMYPTKASEHHVGNTPGGRDLVGATVEAARRNGLRIGFYYSLSDWHHPDYPAWQDDMRPYRLGWSPPLPSPEQGERFRTYLRTQITELLTWYGPVDLLWFDGAWERSPDWWDTQGLASLIHSLQPDVLINDRLPGQGDFTTPEQFIPAVPPPGRWESCLTMNTSWGWNTDDDEYKSGRTLVHTLCETVGRGGNLLLNVSPRGDGTLPPEQVERLDIIGRWMAKHHEAVRGTVAGLEPWQFYGPSSRRGDRVYLFLLARPYDSVTVRGLPVRRVRSASVVGSGEPLEFSFRTTVFDMLVDDPQGELTIHLAEHHLDDDATVIAVDIEGIEADLVRAEET